MSHTPVKHVVILGGGSAGWLTAGVIAAEHKTREPDGLRLTLIESPGVPPIGVGEGTWPSMRSTLAKMGISETELFRECEASFKQGAKFARWVNNEEHDYYYHPLVEPHGFLDTDLVEPWLATGKQIPFADAICSQGALCEHGKAPKQITTPEFAAVANYAYHLNSGKLGDFLRKHCIEKLGVTHIVDHVEAVIPAPDGSIQALKAREHGELEGDLFIDCSGFSSLLLGKHFKIPFVSKKHILFNDTALAVHVPYVNDDDPIASHTISTAQSAGWIWDIGLPSRRGVGAVFSSAHISDDAAADELSAYIAASIGKQKAKALEFRKILIDPGHREVFWHKNCVAVGLAAGFLEPLEASALVLVEAAAGMISAEMPASTELMEHVAKRYNTRFHYYWDTIIDFLKLHYILSKRRDSQYWIDNMDSNTIPEQLQERLELWQYQVPNKYDFPLTEEMFPAASWQYVLYGMGFETKRRVTSRRFSDLERFKKVVSEVQSVSQRYLSHLPENRELINKIYQHGLRRI